MNSTASSPSRKPLAALAMASSSRKPEKKCQHLLFGPLDTTRKFLGASSKRINGNQIGSNFFFVHVKMFDVALQLLQKNLESELY